MVLLCIDESGNTSETIALGLVAIPDKSIEPLCQLFTLRPTDPVEIRALYQRDPEKNKRKPGELLRPRNEFKYSDFLNAENVTNLQIYRQFIKEKLLGAAKLPLQVFCSVFDKPNDNESRLRLLNLEAQTLLHTWTRNNLNEAFSKSLKICVDRQVFTQEMLFEVYVRRNKSYCKIFPTKHIGGIVHYGGMENEVVITERSSKEFKPLQFADFAVGAIREAKMFDKTDAFEILRPITRKDNIRDLRGNYSPLKGLEILK